MVIHGYQHKQMNNWHDGPFCFLNVVFLLWGPKFAWAILSQLIFYHTYDLSFASTETKYIKLKTQTQNNIVIFGFFHKRLYYYFGFFLNNLTKKTSVYKKISSFGFWFFSFLVFRPSNGLLNRLALFSV